MLCELWSAPYKAFVRPAQRLRLSRNKCRAEIRPRWSRRLQRMAKYLYRLRRLSPLTALGPSVIQEPALRKRFRRIPRPLTTAAGSRRWISTVCGPNIGPRVEAKPSEPIDTAAGWQGRIGAVAGDLRLTVWRRRIYDSRFHDRSRAASPLTACFVRSVERVFQALSRRHNKDAPRPLCCHEPDFIRWVCDRALRDNSLE